MFACEEAEAKDESPEIQSRVLAGCDPVATATGVDPESLEALIPPDHPVRLVDEILDQLDWSQYEAAYHGRRGQPPIHPSVLAKILLFGMIRRVRSSRQIEYELKHSIDFLWLASGRRIDHATLSEFRRQHTEALANLETTDALEQDLFGDEQAADRLPANVADPQDRCRQLAELQQQTQAMDEARRDNGSQGPAQLPKTDPDARVLPNKEGGYAPNYTPLATTETGCGLIVHCDVVIGNVEHNQLTSIIDAVNSDYQVEVERALVDAAYTTGENLTASEARGVELIGPLAETQVADNPALRADLTQPVAGADLDRLPINPQTKRFDKSAFVYDAASDSYYCPQGKALPHRTTEHTTHGTGQPVVRSVYTCRDCAGCPLAGRCRRNPDLPRGREVMHDEREAARRRHCQRMQTPQAQEAKKRRLHFGELPFAVIKVCVGLRRFLLRGQAGVHQEWRWASTAFNTKKTDECDRVTARRGHPIGGTLERPGKIASPLVRCRPNPGWLKRVQSGILRKKAPRPPRHPPSTHLHPTQNQQPAGRPVNSHLPIAKFPLRPFAAA